MTISIQENSGDNIITEEGEVVEPKPIQSVIPYREGIVRAAVTPTQAIEAWRQYQDLCKAVLDDDDFQTIGNKKFKKKSSWRKLANFFNLSVEMVTETKVNEPDGSFSFDVTYKAIAPNGRSVTGDGSANSREHSDEDNTRHNVRGTAHTRSFNRAVSNLIGGGEVSAEEAEQGPRNKTYAPETISENTKFKFGKHKDKTLKEVGGKVALHYLESILDMAKKEGKEGLSGQAKDIYDYLLSFKKKAEETTIHSDEEIPDPFLNDK